MRPDGYEFAVERLRSAGLNSKAGRAELKIFHRPWRAPIERYELPDLHGLNFVFHDALEGGVNASLNLDFHGKSFSYLLLGMTVEVER